MEARVQRDYWPTVDWRESTPQEQGMEPDVLLRLDTYLKEVQTRPELNTVLIVRHGRIVFEYYAQGYHQQSYQLLQSMTKSVISTLIGIALQQGYLHELDQRWEDFFPEYFTAETDVKKKQITLRHLLKMTSGLNPDTIAYPGRFGENPKDWVRFAIEKPTIAPPDRFFMYCSLGSHLLSCILTRATGMSTLEFARKYLFAPLGIASDEQAGFEWETDPQGYYIGGARMRLKARDAAKIGYLYLNKGQWEGTQIISPDYAVEAMRAHSGGGPPEAASYGYHWWVTEQDGHHSFFAAGFGGQYIQVIPDLELVLVIFAPDAPFVGVYHRNFIASLFALPAIQDA
jgi:CubicO group peptidase (beta-lactamase class C family)